MGWSGTLFISYWESLGNQLRQDACVSDNVHKITLSLYISSVKFLLHIPFITFFFLPGSYSSKTLGLLTRACFTSCELIFNSTSVAWWKLCFPFHLNLVSQNTRSSPLCGASGNYRQAGQDELTLDGNTSEYEVQPHATPIQSLRWDLYHPRRLPWLKSRNGSRDLWSAVS